MELGENRKKKTNKKNPKLKTKCCRDEDFDRISHNRDLWAHQKQM